MNIHQTSHYARFLDSIGWTTERLNNGSLTTFAFIRKLPFLPVSLMKLQRIAPHAIDWNWVSCLEKKYRVYETLIELDEYSSLPPHPHTQILDHRFTIAPDYMLNTKTRVVDLTKHENTLKKTMKPKTRYNLGLSQRHGLQSRIWTTKQVIETPELFESVYTLLKRNAKRIKMVLLPRGWIYKQFKAFADQGFVVGISMPGKNTFEAVAVFYCSIDTCSYNHNGSTELGRKLMAPTLAVWEGIKEGKRRQLPWFDFDGVFDARYPKQYRFQGFGRFKAGFGGNELYFPPMYRKFRNPFLSS